MPKNYRIRPIAAAMVAAMSVSLPWPGDSGQVLAQVGLPGVDRSIGSMMDRFEPRLPEPRLGKKVEPVIDELPVTEPVSTVEKMLGDITQGLSTELRQFSPGVDQQGYHIEANRVVILLTAEQLQQLASADVEIIAVRELSGLGLIMVVAQPAPGVGLTNLIEMLRNSAPASSVDFNHLYRFAAPPNSPQLTSGPAEVSETNSNSPPETPALRIGMIDSAVATAHSGLQSGTIVTADFNAHTGQQSQGHGTAVASLLTAGAGQGASIYAAAVFFEAENYGPAATLEAILGALDWMVREQVPVINISMTGPHNVLLQRAVNAVVAQGTMIVAAVGNNGPHGEPLFPAAYPDVIGVTAIDRNNQVFLYANRGPHVDYAAIGVDVQVANDTGGWRNESGTSMAAPTVTLAVAQLPEAQRRAPQQLRDALSAAAVDIGTAGFDPIFGNGRIEFNSAVQIIKSASSDSPH